MRGGLPSSLPSVTVVIPTYQRNDLLERALESVASQVYGGHVDAVVVDSNSDPVAKPVVEAFDFATYFRQVDYFPRHATGTHNAALSRDVGVYHATGRYVHFLDDDDELTPNAIDRKLEALDENENARGAYNAIETPTGSIKSVSEDTRGNEISYILKTLQSPAPASTLLVERDVLTASQPQRLMTHTDFGTLIELLLRTNLTYVDEPLTKQNETRGAGYSRATQIKRLETARRYAGLRTKLLTPQEQSEALETYHRIRQLASLPDFP